MTYQYQPWPCWAYGPNGESAIFQCEEDVPKGWSHHGGGKVRPFTPDEMKELRAAYKVKFGKRPFNGWDAAAIREKLDAREE